MGKEKLKQLIVAECVSIQRENVARQRALSKDRDARGDEADTMGRRRNSGVRTGRGGRDDEDDDDGDDRSRTSTSTAGECDSDGIRGGWGCTD